MNRTYKSERAHDQITVLNYKFIVYIRVNVSAHKQLKILL